MTEMTDERIDALLRAHLPAEADRLVSDTASARAIAVRMERARRTDRGNFRLLLIAAVVATGIGGALIGSQFRLDLLVPTPSASGVPAGAMCRTAELAPVGKLTGRPAAGGERLALRGGQLVVVMQDGAVLRELAGQRSADAFSPRGVAWSASAGIGAVVFFSPPSAGASACADLFLVDLDGRLARLTTSTADEVIMAPAWSSDGRILAYKLTRDWLSGSSKELHLRDVTTGADRIVASIACGDREAAFASPDGKRAAFDCDETIQVVEFEQGQVAALELGPLAGLADPITWTADSSALVIGGADRPTIVDVATGEIRRTFEIDWTAELAAALDVPPERLHPRVGIEVAGIALAPDSRHLAVGVQGWVCPQTCTTLSSFDGAGFAAGLFLVDLETGDVDLRDAWPATELNDLRYDERGQLQFRLIPMASAAPTTSEAGAGCYGANPRQLGSALDGQLRIPTSRVSVGYTLPDDLALVGEVGEGLLGFGTPAAWPVTHDVAGTGAGSRGLVVVDLTGAVRHGSLIEMPELGNDAQSFLTELDRPLAYGTDTIDFDVSDVVPTSLDRYPALAATVTLGSHHTSWTHIDRLGPSRGCALEFDLPNRLIVADVGLSIVGVQMWADTDDELDRWLPDATRALRSLRFEDGYR